MERLVLIVGYVHLAAYAAAGFSVATILFVDWLLKRFKLKAELIRAYARLIKDREEAARTATAKEG